MTAGFVATERFEPVLAVEYDPDAAHTYATNFGDDHLHMGRIEDVDTFPSADVVVGGPPCQGFSPLNRQRAAAESRKLWREYWRVLKQVAPRAFVMENVPELLSSEEFGCFEALATGAGYRLRSGVLNAADFGVPQRRRRAVVVGLRDARDDAHVPWPKPTHGPNRKPYVTVRDALAGVPFEPDESDWHRARKPRPESFIRYAAVPPDGGNRHQMKKTLDASGLAHLVPPCWRKHSSGSHDVFGRLWWDRPAPTIRTEFYKPEKGRYLHPEAHRSITIREGALLQSMGDFEFPEDQAMTAVGRQIGNAVPPLLAKAIADAVLDDLERPDAAEVSPATHSACSSVSRRAITTSSMRVAASTVDSCSQTRIGNQSDALNAASVSASRT